MLNAAESRWPGEKPATIRRFDELPNLETASIAEDLAWTLDRLRARGLEQVIMVDLTIASIGLPVVRVLVPGLEDRSHRGSDELGERAQAVAS